MPKILSDRDAAELERMLRWWRGNTDIRYQRRRRHGGGGGGGGGGGTIAYCKIDAPDDDEIPCYLDADVLQGDDEKTYAKNDWIEMGGLEYKSLQDGNLNHSVNDPLWWEEGTKAVIIKCLIINGSSLMYAAPFLNDGDPIIVGKISVDGTSAWYCTNIEFNGAQYLPWLP